MTMLIPADKVFFTADTHYFHKNINRIMNRPFKDMDEMIDTMIRLWNVVVPRDGIVFHLGDVSFGKADETLGVIGQLNGNIHLIRGNHDKDMKGAVKSMFLSINDYLEIKVAEAGGTTQGISLMHYAMRVWNKSHYGTWQLHGHSHGSMQPIGKQLDVGVDCCDYKPISYYDIKKYMQTVMIVNNDHHRNKEED